MPHGRSWLSHRLRSLHPSPGASTLLSFARGGRCIVRRSERTPLGPDPSLIFAARREANERASARTSSLAPALDKRLICHRKFSPIVRGRLPQLGDNPSTDKQGTTPGSFANRGRVGTAWTFSSPDTPGMPQPSDLTAMDFRDAASRSGAQDATRRRHATA